MLEDLFDYCRIGGRICPAPQQWNRLYQLLPGRFTPGGPRPPLILSAWWQASDAAKARRFEEHLRYAAEHGVLAQVDAFVRSLPDGDWHCEGKPW